MAKPIKTTNKKKKAAKKGATRTKTPRSTQRRPTPTVRPLRPQPETPALRTVPTAPPDALSETLMVPIVGVGASAGGLEALTSLLSGAPEEHGLAFVVVQHLDPTQETLLAELLQRRTTMPVVAVRDGVTVEANHVYVIPPDRDLTVMHGVLHIFPPSAPRGQRLPIDHFLRTLAADRRDKSIAVILSGMGTDGSLGIKAVKEAGGLVMAQALDDAKFDSMPRSAIETGLVDVTAPANEIAGRILSLLSHPPLGPIAEGQRSDDAPHSLDKILVLLRSRTRQDFSAYKRSTLHRRVDRRMAIHQLSKLPLYLRFLQENPQELDLLFKELLIGVTSFFRDPAAWEYLGSEVIPKLIDGCADGGTLRAWVAGCSTGEEAYSLAMAFQEAAHVSRPNRRVGLQVFATDIDPAAIVQARQGLYPLNICADVSPERMTNYFVQEKGPSGTGVVRCRVAREVREMVTFATQNVLSDPPFTKLNLLICRNLLIYVEAAAQQKIFNIFHYSLNPNGVLFLGNAESTNSVPELFAPLDAKLRIFQRRESLRYRAVPDFPSSRGPAVAAPMGPADVVEPSLQQLADQVLLQQFSPAAVLVNAEGDILYVSGRTGKYLEPATGRANFNLFAMARDGMQHQLPAALRRAAKQEGVVRLPRLRVKTNGDYHAVDVSVQALREPGQLHGTFFVVFADAPELDPEPEAPGKGARRRRRASNESSAALESEAIRLRDELASIGQEMQASQEELKSANEEMQSTNEELQSTNEELTTSKEEMQSLNEELQTVNAELRSKLDELQQANNDMKNLLNSTEIATLFLDDELRLRRFTTKATRIFKLIPSDVGRPITDIVSDLVYSDLAVDIHIVLETLRSIEKEVATRDGRWYSLRILPYRTMDNVIDGAVLTFSEITTAKLLEAQLRRLGGSVELPAASTTAGEDVK